MCREDNGYEFRFNSSGTEMDIWELLSSKGIKVIVINVPNVHYAFKINGSIVAGWLYQGKGTITYPETLKKEVDEITGGYEIDVMDIDMSRNSDTEDIERDRDEYVDSLGRLRYMEKVYEVMENRFKAVEFLLKGEWEFAFVVFVAPDRIQHRFWKKEFLLDLYKRIDLDLGRLLTRIDDDTTVIMVSDHGFGPKKRIFLINEWLLKEGYLCVKNISSSRLLKLQNAARKFGITCIIESFINTLPIQLSRRLKGFLKGKVKPFRVKNSSVDWKKTKVFAPPLRYTSGELYLNVKNREREGTIDPEDYERIRNEIIHKLGNLTDPKSGKKVTVTAYKKEQIYCGEHTDKAPDLVMKVDGEIQAFNASLGYDQIFMEGQGGEHRVNGIFLAYGPDIKKGIEIGMVKIYDVTPTILHIFGLPIPKDTDGRVLKEIVEPRSEIAKREVEYQNPITARKERTTTWSNKEEEKIKERLQKLGYI
jgi:predicted AlkP superfamily phosphohydrolase/phosphomutase